MSELTTAKFKYVNNAGVVADGELNLEDYKRAHRLGMSVSGFVNAKYRDANQSIGTAFQQGMQNLGIYVKGDPTRGIRATTIEQLMEGTVAINMAGEGSNIPGGTIVAPDGRTAASPSTRVFFPEVILQTMQEKLLEDYSLEASIWSAMIKNRQTIDSEVYIQPKIDITAPRDARMAPTAQNTLPGTMISITASETSKAVPSLTLGLQISEQAQRRADVDLVTTLMSQQAEGQRLANLWSDISKVVSGNKDAGEAALPVTLGTAFDAGFTGGVVTQKGWMKLLYTQDRTVSYDSIICDLDAFLALENRSGRPLIYDPTTGGANTGNAGSYGWDVAPNLLNRSVGVPNVMIVPDGVIPAGHLLVFDSRYALREITNASATYAATESMILQRTDVFRVDVGRLLERFIDDSFLVIDFS